jgi:inorganic pyrophosphatase
MSYIILRGPWCDIIVLNVHASTEDQIDDMEERFYGELEHVFEKYPKYHVKILLGDFSAKIGKSFSNQQLGMRVYTKLVMIMELG